MLLDHGGYFDMTTRDLAVDLRKETVRTLRNFDIQVEYSHHEVGPSQHEIDLRYDRALRMADKVMTYRLVVKEVAQLNGVYATFMPKPMYGEAGSGMHVHQSLFRGDSNAFYDPSDEFHLSDTAKSYVAGLLYHARAICAVTNQWVNSYKRLVSGYEAPVYICWAHRNRSRARPRADVQAGQGEGDPRRTALARSGLQPLSRVLGDAGRRARRHSARTGTARRRHRQHLRDERRRARRLRHRVSCRRA